MVWQGVEGHNAVVEQFRRRLDAGRVNGTFLFVGPPGVGKRMTAERLAAALLCCGGNNPSLDPCGTCEDCRLSTAGNHPDLLIVEKPADRTEIPLRLLIGEGDTRMREGLCHDIGMKPYRGGRRVAIIDDADDLNTEGANCLLKTLEEPPPRSVMILISQSMDRQLPTIRSRSQLIRFQPLDVDVLARLIQNAGLASTPADAERLAAASDGSLERARMLADPAIAEYRAELQSRLAEGGWNAAAESRALLQFAEGAGKESAPRRRRLRIALSLMAEFYREVIHRSAGGGAGPSAVDLERLADVVERCLTGVEHIDRNAHPTAVVEALCDDLGKLLAV